MKTKKILLALASMTLMAAPIAAVISCSSGGGDNGTNQDKVLAISAKVASQEVINTFSSNWNEQASKGEKITLLKTLFQGSDLNEANLDNFSVVIKKEAPISVTLKALTGFVFGNNQKEISSTTVEKPLINVVNETITQNVYGHGAAVPYFGLGFGTGLNNNHGSYFYDYKIADQVYNFKATINVDAYDFWYRAAGEKEGKTYRIPSFSTEVDFDFSFAFPYDDGAGNHKSGYLKLESPNPDYRVEKGGAPSDTSTNGYYDSIITTAAKGLPNSFKVDGATDPTSNLQMQFQVGLGGNYGHGLRFSVWPFTYENATDRFGGVSLLEQTISPNPQMSITFSISPKN
ncbi:MAG: hypothetical protein ACRCRZ_01165 [Metamycoplasmataceae bacterium]